MRKWKSLEKTTLLKGSFFSLSKEKCQLSDHRIIPSYYVLNFSDWVHVAAFTKDKKMILVKQYRHAVRKIFLELPGGGIDSKTIQNIKEIKNKKTKKREKALLKKETPLQAGRRELLEETGYFSKQMKKIGFHYPNPALLSNKIHVFLALNCKKIKEPKLDAYEDLKTVIWEIPRLIQWINLSKFQHSLMMPSLYMALQKINAL